MQGTEAYKYAFLSSNVDPWTSEGERRTETEEDTGGELIREYKRAARISHKRTESAIVSAKKTLE